MSQQQTYIAKTLFGLEPVLAEELRQLGATDVLEHNRAVNFKGDTELLYKANIWLRTAIRILVPLKVSTIKDESTLYKEAYNIRWFDYFNVDQTFAVHALTNTELFDNSMFVALKVKDAIADRFRKEFGRRPNVDREEPHAQIHVHVYQNQCTILIDSSGESLHRRGYKVGGFKAPLSEILAAGMVYLSGWDKQTPLYDPMCGSGTILTEAALIAHNIAPGLYREDFGFMHWPDFDLDLYRRLQKEAMAAEVENDVPIYGSDVSMRALQDAQDNLDNAELEDFVELKQINFEQSKAPAEAGMIIMNPPYGERIDKDDLIAFYKTIGDTFKQEYTGWTAWVLSGNIPVLKHLGLRPSRKIPLYNGQIECRFNKYEMYAGTKKIHKLQ